MKKQLLFLSAFTISLGAFSQGGYLPNSSFENWTTSTIYENPDIWASSNLQEGGAVAVTKSTDAQHLTASVKLVNYTYNNGFGLDTSFSYCFLGEIGESGPDGGMPYATPVNRINGFYKGTIGTNDTAIVLVIKYNAGIMVSMDALPIFTSQTNWTAFNFTISSAPQDSIFLGFISSNPFANTSHANPSTSIQFDNISLSHSVNGAGPALPNYSFETWVPINSTTPDDWTTINDVVAAFSLEPVTESTDAFTGSSSAKVETILWNTDTIPGMLIYGNLVIGNQPTPVPYDATPTNFTGAYKYSPSNGDQGFISFEFYSGGIVNGGNFFNMNSSSTYVPFNVPTNLVGTPDSVIVAVYTGENPGSFAIVDDLNFAGGNVSVQEITGLNFMVYPNPTTDFINIKGLMSGSYNVSIYDLNGKLVLSQVNNGIQSQIDVRHLAGGNYTMSVENKGKISSKTISIIK